MKTRTDSGPHARHLAELRARLVEFAHTSKVELGVGRAGWGIPFVGCGAGIGFFSSVEIPLIGGLLSTVARNVLAADSQLTGGKLRQLSHASSRLIPGIKAGTGCGIGIGYGYGAGLWLTPGAWKPIRTPTEEQGESPWGGSGEEEEALSSRLDRIERRVAQLERQAQRDEELRNARQRFLPDGRSQPLHEFPD